MGWLIVAFGTVFLLIVGHIQNSQRVEVVKMQQSGSSHLLARQLLSLAAGINDWRYRHTLTNGTVALSALALPVTPDSRIRHVIVANRLWVWMPEVPGLVDALREQSGGSALIGTVTKGHQVLSAVYFTNPLSATVALTFPTGSASPCGGALPFFDRRADEHTLTSG